MAKKPKYSKKAFDDIVTGDETWVYYFEPKRKVAKRIWATKMPDAQVLPNEYERKEAFVCFFH